MYNCLLLYLIYGMDMGGVIQMKNPKFNPAEQSTINRTAAMEIGLCCELCGIYFDKKNDKPVICKHCFSREDLKHPGRHKLSKYSILRSD